MTDEEDDFFVTPYLGKRSKSRLKRKLPPVEKRNHKNDATSKKIEMRVNVIAGLHAGEFRQLICESGDPIDCGRSKKRKLSFPNDYSVSETHAVMYIEASEDSSTFLFRICDRNSTNGTRLNGKLLRAGIETSSDLPVHSVELGDTCFQVTLKKVIGDDGIEKNLSKVSAKPPEKSCFVCAMSLDHLTDAELQVHVNRCLDNQESAKNKTPPPPSTTTTTTTTTTSTATSTTPAISTEQKCPFCFFTFGSATDLLQHIKPCAATKKIENEKLFDEIRKIRSHLAGKKKRKNNDTGVSKKTKKRKKKSKPLVEAPRLGRKAKLAAKKDPELALALALSVSMECLDALPTEEIESRLSTLQTQISNLQDRAAILHEILQRRHDLSKEKARVYEKKCSDELAIRRVALIDPSKAAQSLFGGGIGMCEERDEDSEEKVEEEKERIEEEKEKDRTETKGRSRREVGLSLWNMTACAGDDNLDGVMLTQSKFCTTSLLNDTTKEKNDNDMESEKEEDNNDGVVVVDDDDDDPDITGGEDLSIHEEEDVDLSIHEEEDVDLSIHEEEDVDLSIHEEKNEDLSIHDKDETVKEGEDESSEKKKHDDSIIDLTQQQQPTDDNDESHIFDTQKDDMREMLLGIADANSDLPSTQSKASSFSLEESTIMYDHIEDDAIPAPVAVVTGGSSSVQQNDDIIVLSDDEDENEKLEETKTKPLTTTPRSSKTMIKISSSSNNNCPDYAGMKVNELHELVKGYGMRKCSKRIMVEKLTEIWHYLNDKTVATTSHNNVLQPIVSRTSSQPVISKSSTSRTKIIERSVSTTAGRSEENADPRTAQLITYIRSHRKLHEKMLMMQTIDLTSFKDQLKCDGIRVSTTFLRSFLQEQGISYSQPWRNK